MRVLLYVLVFFIISLNSISSSSSHLREDPNNNPQYNSISQAPGPNRNPSAEEDKKDKTNKFYPGVFEKTLNYNVEVESYLSLGGEYTEKVRKAIRNSDQFVIFFMYRFNHPALIQEVANKLIQKDNECIPLVFLDYRPFSVDKSYGGYRSYVRYLYQNVPLSFVKLERERISDQNKKFHHKVIVCKKTDEKALTFIGSANATYEADNLHSEDTLCIRSNKLASILLKNFDTLFNNSSVKVFDENRFSSDVSNREALRKYKDILKGSNIKSIPLKYTGTITSLAISGFYNEKKGRINNQCLNLIQDSILNKEKYTLLYFQNFFNIGKPKKGGAHHFSRVYSSFFDDTQTNSSRLAVIWTNSTSDKKRIENLKSQLKNENSIIAFTPYTKGKFHHKAIIKYPEEGEPILYTGSFNFSESALKNNSETIIGIQGSKLVEDYLSSLLWNSGLADEPEIWNFFKNSQILRPSIMEKNSSLHILSNKVSSRNEKNIQRFSDRVHNTISSLKEMVPEKYLPEHNQAILNETESLFKPRIINIMDCSEKLDNIKNQVFSDKKNSIGQGVKNYIIHLFSELSVGLEDSIKEKTTKLKALKSKVAGLDENDKKFNEFKKSEEKFNEFKKSVEEFKDKNDKNWIKSVQKTLNIIKSKKQALSNLKRDILYLTSLLEDLSYFEKNYANLTSLKEALSQEPKPVLKRKAGDGSPNTDNETDVDNKNPVPKKQKKSSHSNTSSTSNSGTKNNEKNSKEVLSASDKNEQTKRPLNTDINKQFKKPRKSQHNNQSSSDVKSQTSNQNQEDDDEGESSNNKPKKGTKKPSNNIDKNSEEQKPSTPRKGYNKKSSDSKEEVLDLDGRDKRLESAEESSNKSKKKKDAGQKAKTQNYDSEEAGEVEKQNNGNSSEDGSGSDSSSSDDSSKKKKTSNTKKVVKIPTKDKKQSSKEDSNQDYDSEFKNNQTVKKLNKKDTLPKKQELKKTKEPIDDFESQISYLYGNNLQQDISRYYDDLDAKYKTQLTRQMNRLGLTKEDLKSKETMKEKWKNYDSDKKIEVKKLLNGLKNELNSPDPNYVFGL